MPYRPTPLQNIKKHLKSSKALIARIENELSDERTDKAERSRLLVSLAKLTKDVRSLENKRAKLSAQARGKMPLINRLIGFQNLEFVRRGDGCLMASYSYRNQSFEVPIPNSRNQMSMAKYPAYVASRDAAEKIARSSESNPLPDISGTKEIKEAVQGTEIDFSKVAAILSGKSNNSNNTHVCGEGCRLFGCSVQDAAKTAARAAAAAMVVPCEPAPVEAAASSKVNINIEPVPVTDTPEDASSKAATSEAALTTNTLRDNPSDAEVLRWINSITPKQVKIVPDADLECQTLDYWKEKATVTVKRMIELYHAFSSTLSREASLKFDNHQRQLTPMLNKLLYHEPETLRGILGENAAILLNNSTVYEKPVIDAPTQMRFMSLTRKDNR